MPRRRRITNRILIVLAVFVVIISTGLVAVYKHLEGNIGTIDISGELGTNRPKPVVFADGKPINVLVMGDDTRKGQGPKIGGSTPGLSDTTILLHISANRKFAYGVSIPRDSMVHRPACKTGDGSESPAGLIQFNAAYAVGGPGCTVKTVEQLTGIHIDHFVVIKFRAFRGMVDAIGGVTVCLPQAINDDIGHISLPAGTYSVTGEQALDYVRVRHGIGSGDDIGRMKRQQAFIAALINKVVSAGTLANPVRLYKFLDATTKGLTTDPDFAHLKQLVSLGGSLKSIGLDHIKFITVPWEAYPPDAARVQWAPDAAQLWHRIKYDQPLGSRFDSEVINASNTPGKTKKPTSSGSSTTTTPSNNPSPSEQASANAARYGLCA